MGETIGDGRQSGLKTGLSPGTFFCLLMENQKVAKLPDTELVRFLLLEFPSSTTNFEKYLEQYRNKFNRGEWSCQSSPPQIPAIRYDHAGKPKPKRRGPRARLPTEDPKCRE